jgi:hypothetical protein
VFGSVEAIAFAAAGALFGVSVQREGVKNAEERADAKCPRGGVAVPSPPSTSPMRRPRTRISPISHSAAEACRTRPSVDVMER